MNRPIDERLFSELKTRNSKLIPPHIVTIAAMAWWLKDVGVFYPFFIIGISLALRVVWMKKMTRITLSYLFFMWLTGFGWGLVSLYTYRFYGLYSPECFSVLGTMVILMSGGVTAFSPSMKVASIFFLSLVVVPAYILFTDPGKTTFLLGILLVINFLYSVYHAGVSHKLMRQLIEAEQRAISQKHTYQDFINAIPGLVAVIDINEKFIMVNNNFEGFFKDVIGKKLSHFYPDSEITKSLVNFSRGEEKEAVKEIRTSIDGNDSWYMVHLRKITSPEIGIVAAIQPITELIKAKNDLRIQESRSQYSAKLASLGEFSANIAHEVNNPLTIIEGSVSFMKILLEDKDIDRQSLFKATHKISETATRIAKIIKSLRTLSGNADEEPFTNVTFQSIVDPALEISRPKLLSHKINLTIHGPSEKVDLFGNEVQLSQVMMNLISNAIDAVKDLEGDRWIQIHYNALVESLDVTVVDSGKGVDEAIRARIMDPFFTTKVSHQGTGLGLSISKTIIENHQGTLTLLTDAPHTTFRMRFPRMNPWIKKTELVEETDVVPESAS